MDENIVQWHPMMELPETPGYILLAIRHNNLNDVVMGHYNSLRGFRCNTYQQGVNTQFCYWAYMPKHPDGESWKKINQYRVLVGAAGFCAMWQRYGAASG